MKANSREEAWRIADRLFPTDYEKNEESSKRAGYKIYETTSKDEKFVGFHISDLNTRLEVNMGTETVTIWIEEMTKEKAIMELMSNAKQIEALETCIKILDTYKTMDDLTEPLKRRQQEIEQKNEKLYDIAAGGKFELEKAF